MARRERHIPGEALQKFRFAARRPSATRRGLSPPADLSLQRYRGYLHPAGGDVGPPFVRRLTAECPLAARRSLSWSAGYPAGWTSDRRHPVNLSTPEPR